VLGWLVAGRMLRPLRTMNTAIKRISARNVHERLDRTRVDDHHGLGLSIVRAIAIAHDATLTANARPQGGLSIAIHFPLIPFAMPR
jgi:signal transduction histidine kinase